MARVLLLLPSGTYRAPDFLAAARALGVEVVVASDRRQAMSSTLGDRALTLSLRDPETAAERTVALAERTPLDAVVAADEAGVLAAAHARARDWGCAATPPRRPRERATRRRCERLWPPPGSSSPTFASPRLGPKSGDSRGRSASRAWSSRYRCRRVRA